jgi:hypothetical protein
MTKIAATILLIICILLIRQGIREWNLGDPPDHILSVRLFGAAMFLLFFVGGLYVTDKSLLEFFSFIWK